MNIDSTEISPPVMQSRRNKGKKKNKKGAKTRVVQSYDAYKSESRPGEEALLSGPRKISKAEVASANKSKPRVDSSGDEFYDARDLHSWDEDASAQARCTLKAVEGDEKSKTEVTNEQSCTEVETDVDGVWQPVVRRKTKSRNAESVKPQQKRLPVWTKGAEPWRKGAINSVFSEYPAQSSKQPPLPERAYFVEVVDLKKIGKVPRENAYDLFITLMKKINGKDALNAFESVYMGNIFAELLRNDDRNAQKNIWGIEWFLWFYKNNLRNIYYKFMFVFDRRMTNFNWILSDPSLQGFLNRFMGCLQSMQSAMLNESVFGKVGFFGFVDKLLNGSEDERARKQFMLKAFTYKVMKDCTFEMIEGKCYRKSHDKRFRRICLAYSFTSRIAWLQASFYLRLISDDQLCSDVDDVFYEIEEGEKNDKELFQNVRGDIENELYVLVSLISRRFGKVYGYEDSSRRHIELVEWGDGLAKKSKANGEWSEFMENKLYHSKVVCLRYLVRTIEKARLLKYPPSFDYELNFCQEQVTFINGTLNRKLIPPEAEVDIALSAFDRLKSSIRGGSGQRGMLHLTKLKKYKKDDYLVVEIVSWQVLMEDEGLESTLEGYEFKEYTLLYGLLVLLCKTKWVNKAQERIKELKGLIPEGSSDHTHGKHYKHRIIRLESCIKIGMFTNTPDNEKKSAKSLKLLTDAFGLACKSVSLMKEKEERLGYWANIQHVAMLISENKITFTSEYKRMLPEQHLWVCTSWGDLVGAISFGRKNYTGELGRSDCLRHMPKYAVYKRQTYQNETRKGKW